MVKLQVFGGSGFIGSEFVKQNKEFCVVNEKIDYRVDESCKEIVYLISTVTNYNIKVNSFIDIETNLITMMKVLDQCKDKDIVFNFISSWFVYGFTEMPATEESVCNPKGFYSITKKAAEDLLVSFCETFNLKYRILRLANVTGYGDMKASSKKNALQYLVNEIKQNKDINLYEGGKFYRDFIHVSDVAKAIKLIIEKGDVNTIYNIGNGVPYFFKDYLDIAKDIFKSESNFNYIEQPDFHKKVQVLSMWMKTNKLKSLGYTPQYDNINMIKDILR